MNLLLFDFPSAATIDRGLASGHNSQRFANARDTVRSRRWFSIVSQQRVKRHPELICVVGDNRDGFSRNGTYMEVTKYWHKLPNKN